MDRYRSPIIPGDIPGVRIIKSEGRDDCHVCQKRVFRGATRYRIDPLAVEGANHNVFKVSVIRVQLGNSPLLVKDVNSLEFVAFLAQPR